MKVICQRLMLLMLGTQDRLLLLVDAPFILIIVRLAVVTFITTLVKFMIEMTFF